MHDLDALVRHRGTLPVTDLVAQTSARSVGRWLAAGALVRLHPGWLTLPELAEDWRVRAVAATGYSGGQLSHRTALVAHRLLAPDISAPHVTVPVGRRVRSCAGLVVHRTTRLPRPQLVRGLCTTPVERALVDAWGAACSSGAPPIQVAEVRSALLDATRERYADVGLLEAERLARPELSGRGELGTLLGLVRRGCQSPLELYGMLHVFDRLSIPPPRHQVPVVVGGRRYELDAAWVDVKLAVELDGAAFHGSREQRERDLRRDAALAAVGWVVLRFSYRRLITEPQACRAEIEAVWRLRCQQAGRWAVSPDRPLPRSSWPPAGHCPRTPGPPGRGDARRPRVGAAGVGEGGSRLRRSSRGARGRACGAPGSAPRARARPRG